MASNHNSANSVNVNSKDMLWILNEAKNLLKTDVYAAKTWLLVGKTLLPWCFQIRFELYTLEKSSKNATETSSYLEDLLAVFYKEERVWEEVLIILRNVLKEDEQSDEDVEFHRDVFHHLPRGLQVFVIREILRRMPFLMPDVDQQSRFLLYVLDNFSEEMPNQGAYLVDLWLSAEARDGEASLTPVNRFREELVLSVLPKVLQHPAPIPASQVTNWFISAVEYFVFLAAQGCSQQKDQTANNSTPTKVVSLDPWQKLRKLGVMVGKKIGWPEEADILFDSNNSTKVKYKALDTAFRKHMSTLSTMDKPGPGNEVELLKFFSLFLAFFLECLHGYNACLDPQSPSKSVAHHQSANSVSVSRALVEVSLFDELDTVEDLRAKKPRLEEDAVEPNNVTALSDVAEEFLLAAKIWTSLNGGVFTLGLSAMHNHWLIKKKWPWLNQFNIDLMIYEGRYDEGLHLCESMNALQEQDPKVNKNRLLVQLICCAYRSLNSKVFMKAISSWLFKKTDNPLTVPSKGPVTQISLPDRLTSFTFPACRKGIQLRFITLTNQDILSYAAQAMIGCFWNLWKSQSMSSHSDSLIGHMMVLMQHNIYQNEVQLCELLEHIRKQGRFSYHLFTSYLIDITILEEFMFLQSPDGGLVSLDILSTPIQTTQASRTVTRGVNKDTREEMKAAIEKQVLRSSENIHQLIKTFMIKEADLLLKEFN